MKSRQPGGVWQQPFDRTYEGLKPLGTEMRSWPETQPFDRTYEGLKPYAVIRRGLDVQSLLTVPMRV